MKEAFRNMFRRRGRTMLTIFGITIGIFAFVVMGSMAEKINLLVSGGTDYYSDKVIVNEGNSGYSFGPMDIGKADEIRKVDGVKAVFYEVYLPLSDSPDAIVMGIPAAISATQPGVEEYESYQVDFSSGRALRAGDEGKVTVGADLVEKLNAKVGGTVEIRGKDYEVVGIMAKTLTAPDSTVGMMPVDAQPLLHETLPEFLRNQITPDRLTNEFIVYPEDGVDPDKLASRISEEVPGVTGSGPKDFEEQIGNATGILNSILFGIALISLLVGGLSIINTMTMSIAERTKEIGIKKAIGAKTGNIMREYLTEAGLIGFMGGIVGLAIGALTVFTLNNMMQESGNIIFLLTARIAIFAVVFSTILGVLAGIYPAFYAVRINIVKALREG